MKIVEEKIYNGGVLNGHKVTIIIKDKKIILNTGIWGKYQGELGIDSQLYVNACKDTKKDITWDIVSRDCLD